jgi:hypothetical protein
VSPGEEWLGSSSPDNEWSQTTSRLWDFGKSTLLRVRSTKARAPCIDQATIGPLCCDPMITAAPPPELLTYSDLDDFLRVQRPQPFPLLWVHLLDFICTPESVISSEHDLFDDFDFPHTPYVLDLVKLRSKVNDD